MTLITVESNGNELKQVAVEQFLIVHCMVMVRERLQSSSIVELREYLDLDETEVEQKDSKCWESMLTSAKDKLRRKEIIQRERETEERRCLH